jgi:hypothetical protein
MNKILSWFQGNLADKSTWIAAIGVITAFSAWTPTPIQIGAIAVLGSVLFTVRDRHFVAAGGSVKRMCKRKKKTPEEIPTLQEVIDEDRNL